MTTDIFADISGEHIARKLKIKQKIPFTQAQYDLIEKEVELILQKKSQQSANQRKKIIALYIKMCDWLELQNSEEEYSSEVKIDS